MNWFKKKKASVNRIDRYANLKKEITVYWKEGDELYFNDRWYNYDKLSHNGKFLGWDGIRTIKIQSFIYDYTYIDINVISYNASLKQRRNEEKFEDSIKNQAEFDKVFKEAWAEVTK